MSKQQNIVPIKNVDDKVVRASLREDIGAWMFSMLSTLSPEEFKKAVKSMSTNPKLSSFKNKLESIRASYKRLLQVCTPKQQLIASKPLFYGITFSKGRNANSEEYEALNTIQIDIDMVNTKIADVTLKIPNDQQYGGFVNAISQSLMGAPSNGQLLNKITQEQAVANDTIEALVELKSQEQLATVRKNEEDPDHNFLKLEEEEIEDKSSPLHLDLKSSDSQHLLAKRQRGNFTDSTQKNEKRVKHDQN